MPLTAHVRLILCGQMMIIPGLLIGSITKAAEDAADATSGAAQPFVEVSGPIPEFPVWRPQPPLAPPPNSRKTVYDNFDNFWTFVPGTAARDRQVLVLPAQDRSAWVTPEPGGLPPGEWQWMECDEHGYLWVASRRRILRLDPRFPARGWQDFSADSGFPPGSISAIGVGPRGSMLAAVDSGVLVEMDRSLISDGGSHHERNVICTAACPRGVTRALTDGRGTIWLEAAAKIYRSSGQVFGASHERCAAEIPSEQHGSGKYWQLVARMPGCNHDLSGDVMDGRFYVGGGLTNGWGYPARDHDFSQLFEFDGKKHRWRIAADLGQGRVYCTTSFLNHKVWVIGGDVFEKDGSRREMSWVQIVDPTTGKVTDGPDTLFARPMPIAVHINGRIYVAGNPRGAHGEPGRLESIGPGESEWRREPDGPAGFGPLAGCALDGRFYLAVPERFLAVFDTANRAWSTIDVPHPPRSCQMAAFRGEIWLMGGQGVPGRSATQVYDPHTGRWRAGPDLPRQLSWGAAAAVNGKLVVTGGAGRHASDWSYNNRTWVLSP